MTLKTFLDRPFIYKPPADDGLTVLYKDADILVLDKPSGLLSVPGKSEDHKDCLESRAQRCFPEALIVHRLDMDTSGVMVMGLGKQAHRYLSIGFEKRRPSKSYIARVWGVVAQQQGEINLPLICDWPNRPLQKVDRENGKPSLTRWQLLEHEKDGETVSSRVRLMPETGRSHQLRVHMLSLGHPILGDRFYAHDAAWKAASRLQLHADSLTLHHPIDDREMTIEAACPF